MYNKIGGEKDRWLFRKVGGYRIVHYVNKGSSAWIYIGKLGNELAIIKILHSLNGFPHVGMQQKKIRQFLQEAKFLFELNHSSIPRFITFGRRLNDYFLITSYCGGESLQRILNKDKKLSYKEALKVVYKAAQGLKSMHEKNIVHLDIKPGNIVYNRGKNIVSIIDFGCACKILVPKKLNGFKGTPDYSSPEQCANGLVDFRSDIYSLGITFYKLLTGELPFHKNNVVDTFKAQIDEPFKWKPEYRNSFPFEVVAIISKMLAKTKEKRYPDMAAVVKKLKPLVDKNNSKEPCIKGIGMLPGFKIIE